MIEEGTDVNATIQDLHPKLIRDPQGTPKVIALPLEEFRHFVEALEAGVRITNVDSDLSLFDQIMELVEDIEATEAYDRAKSEPSDILSYEEMLRQLGLNA
jgi:hypothetical protein